MNNKQLVCLNAVPEDLHMPCLIFFDFYYFPYGQLACFDSVKMLIDLSHLTLFSHCFTALYNFFLKLW